MLTLPGERAAIDVESTNLSTEVDPREPLRLVQAPPKRAKVSSLPMIGNVGSVAMSTGREGQLVTCAMVLNSLSRRRGQVSAAALMSAALLSTRSVRRVTTSS